MWRCFKKLGIKPPCEWVKVAQSCLILCSPMDYIDLQVPLSVEFSRQEYWSGLPFPSPEDVPNPGLPHCRQILDSLSHQGSPKPPCDPAIPAVRQIPWGNRNWKRHMYPNVNGSIITIARTWKQPRCPSRCPRWMDKETVILLHNGIFSSVAQSCLTLCNPMDCSTPDFPVHHQLPELA